MNTTQTEIPEHWVDPHADEPQPELERTWKKELAAIGSVLLSDASGPPPANRMRWACHELQDMVDTIAGQGKLVFRASLFAVSVLAPLLVFRLPGIRHLSHERATLALERFERSPLGMALFAVQMMMGIVYFEHPAAAEEIGFDGECMGSTTSSALSRIEEATHA